MVRRSSTKLLKNCTVATLDEAIDLWLLRTGMTMLDVVECQVDREWMVIGAVHTCFFADYLDYVISRNILTYSYNKGI